MILVPQFPEVVPIVAPVILFVITVCPRTLALSPSPYESLITKVKGPSPAVRAEVVMVGADVPAV